MSRASEGGTTKKRITYRGVVWTASAFAAAHGLGLSTVYRWIDMFVLSDERIDALIAGVHGEPAERKALARKRGAELAAIHTAHVHEQVDERRKAAEQLEAATAFLADRESKWSRIVTSNERRAR